MAWTGFDMEYRKSFVANVEKLRLPNGQISRDVLENQERAVKQDRKAGVIEGREEIVCLNYLLTLFHGLGMNGNPGLNPSYRGRF